MFAQRIWTIQSAISLPTGLLFLFNRFQSVAKTHTLSFTEMLRYPLVEIFYKLVHALFGITVVRKSASFNSLNMLWVYGVTKIYVVIAVDIFNGRGVPFLKINLAKPKFINRIIPLFWSRSLLVIIISLMYLALSRPRLSVWILLSVLWFKHPFHLFGALRV